MAIGGCPARLETAVMVWANIEGAGEKWRSTYLEGVRERRASVDLGASNIPLRLLNKVKFTSKINPHPNPPRCSLSRRRRRVAVSSASSSPSRRRRAQPSPPPPPPSPSPSAATSASVSYPRRHEPRFAPKPPHRSDPWRRSSTVFPPSPVLLLRAQPPQSRASLPCCCGGGGGKARGK
uniref:Uncharacterized protein n=1 Tax=Oryza meridionalis TaxID=40149 RepID=A0A0E0EB47_9ORYZ